MTGSRLEDEAALSRLVDLYARAIDRADAELLRSLFTKDASLDFGAMFSGGIEAFIGMISSALASMRTHHFMGNRLYAFSEDAAEGEIYSINTHVISGSTGEREYVAGGRYLDRYSCTPEGWRIVHRTRIIDWSREYELSQTEGVAAGANREGDTLMQYFPLLASVSVR